MYKSKIHNLFLISTKSKNDFELFRINGSLIELIPVSDSIYQKFILEGFLQENTLCFNELVKKPGTVIITSSYVRDEMIQFVSDSEINVFGVEEFIDSNGNIIESLTEPNINIVLKKVFAIKPKHVVISLPNGIKNPVHEKAFYNVLKVAGYNVLLSEECFEK
jgi:hypothetical protein